MCVVWGGGGVKMSEFITYGSYLQTELLKTEKSVFRIHLDPHFMLS